MVPDSRDPRVLVVGAGSAGLSVAAALRRRGIALTVLERGDRVGAAWSSRYEELRLNTLRWLSALPGAPIPRSAGRWVTRDQYVAHLAAFATSQRIDVRFGAGVRRIDPEGAGWQVDAEDGRRRAEHVVVATGRAHVPRVPDWPGREAYRGRLLHVAELRRAAELAGRSVLVVGGGNSGVDLCAQLADAGARPLWLSVRSPPTILPLEIAGIPVQPVAVALRRLPDRLRDAMARSMSRAALGDLSEHGLPAPQVGAYTRLRTTGVTVAVDRGFVRHLRAGHVRVVADVSRVDGDEVVLTDGTRLRPDVIVATTGYRPALEPLVGHLGVLDPLGNPRTEPGRPVPGRPGLWFVGYWPSIDGDLYRHPIEARRIARRIAGGPPAPPGERPGRDDAAGADGPDGVGRERGAEGI